MRARTVLSTVALGLGLIACSPDAPLAVGPACQWTLAGLPPDVPVQPGDALPDTAVLIAEPADIEASGATMDEMGLQGLDLRLGAVAKGRLAGYTAANVGGYMALATNRRVLAVPMILDQMPDGQISISFAATDAEPLSAEKLGCVP